jgi:uncharacterized protein involved in type VI secretion and phage assembly
MLLDAFLRFFDSLIQDGLEYFHLYYGTYRGVVVEVDDKNRGRVKVRVPSINGDTALLNWALPCVPFAGANYGFYCMPHVNDCVWITFEGGRLSNPIWTGSWFADDEQPQDMNGKASDIVGLQTRAGHQFMIDDEDGVIRIVGDDGNGKKTLVVITAKDHGVLIQTPAEDSGNTFYLSEAGVLISSQQGHFFSMDDDGVKMTAGNSTVTFDGKSMSVISAGDLTIKSGGTLHLDAGTILCGGDGEMMVKGETLMQWLMGHTHLCSAPSTPSATGLHPTMGPASPIFLANNRKIL